jgi:hypothetical protein
MSILLFKKYKINPYIYCTQGYYNTEATQRWRLNQINSQIYASFSSYTFIGVHIIEEGEGDITYDCLEASLSGFYLYANKKSKSYFPSLRRGSMEARGAS